MKILLAGGSGLVGNALRRSWAMAGHNVLRLVRREATTADERRWDPDAGACGDLDEASFDLVVNLAGENIAAGRWSAARKARLRSSRLAATGLLARLIAGRNLRTGTWINASAIGFYGDTGDREVDEACPAGRGFLASLCEQWEAATGPAVGLTRVVCLRLGVVLDPNGGALAKLLPVFRTGLGGPIGNGNAWMSWVGTEDLCRMFDFVAATDGLAGPVNAVSPSPVRNRDLASLLGRLLGRPAVVPTPAWVLRLLLGQMGEETVLSSQRVSPTRLVEAGYRFVRPTLEAALATAVLRRGASRRRSGRK